MHPEVGAPARCPRAREWEDQDSNPVPAYEPRPHAAGARDRFAILA